MVISIKIYGNYLLFSIISFVQFWSRLYLSNFYLDLQSIEGLISLPAKAYYDAQVLIAKFVS